MADDLIIRRGNLVIDLSGVHVSGLLTRLREALLLGLEASRTGPTLAELVATLAALCRREPVKFFSNPQE